ncbi:TIGR03767 family metallophosphoesterase [Streptomyces sp. H27-D2]|uniref:TIGR03767 family metallophosphoesterase n=1 Tax=Streptomyces sp. H27-D2 TaxID=3046304 RepID=UPI002DBCF4FF|nr:TIGR03767 family metallophosphoesterase [Streptomyces sp. H27-D2]MEC4014873.1 TIGR03767 family metallophosphoesterase [Streptomyces sp. H27-D2]
MARTARTRPAAAHLNRRSFIAAAGGAGVAAGLGLAFGPGGGSATASQPVNGAAAARAAAQGVALTAPAAPVAPSRAGTTLRTVATPRGSAGGYRRLGDGPAWPRAVRTELAAAKAGRTERRTALAAFTQFTDLHIVDVQHPLRYEYLRSSTASAWRPQEALSVAGAASLVERVNGLSGGPVTGLPLSFVMTTGDNTDNNSQAELDWFLGVMNGGRITPNTGDPRRYEGVQNSGLPLYWQPDAAVRDADKRRGFPRLDGYLAAAISTVNSPGLTVPWYSTAGNHDSLPGGCYAAGGFFADFAVGGRKLEQLPEAEGAALWKTVKRGGDPKGKLFAELLRGRTKSMREVTPDPRRAPFTPRQYLQAHLDPRQTGPGPVGHGYTAANLADDHLHYSFRIARDVIGVSLDTTDSAGHYEGSLGTGQLRWLERTLKDHKDEHVLVFSHHTAKSMRNLRPDPARPGERRHGGDELVALLGRHRNVAAWINGHSHKNAITPHGAFWEISTASHIDFPQLARVIELVDNHDGTLSLFTTLIESAAPHRTDFADLSQTGLAALYRELSFNAAGARTELSGTAGDRNTELLLLRR